MQQNFEKLVADRRKALVESLLRAPDGDAIAHTKIKGVIVGMDEAAALYRQAAKLDLEAA